jgi:ABC-type lipoprotein release transport system permease subunit
MDRLDTFMAVSYKDAKKRQIRFYHKPHTQYGQEVTEPRSSTFRVQKTEKQLLLLLLLLVVVVVVFSLFSFSFFTVLVYFY